LADTFGVCSSHTIPFAIGKIRERIDKPLETHFHNDFGQATANTLQALAAGAAVAHTTVTGIGERSGNAPYEEVALSLETLYGKETGIKIEKMRDLSLYIRQICNITVAENRPIVGNGLFTFESGIIVGIWRKCRKEHLLEIIPFVPELVGHEPIQVALGKKSGLESINEWLEKLDITISHEEREALLAAVKERAMKSKRLLGETEFKALLVDQVIRGRAL
jgi:isopropylmalate/homocitrate/citramalate synthase